jgi:protoheme IX farnesyltransferase
MLPKITLRIARHNGVSSHSALLCPVVPRSCGAWGYNFGVASSSSTAEMGSSAAATNGGAVPVSATCANVDVASCDTAVRRVKKTKSLGAIYAELAKARLSSLVVLTSGAGFLMAGAPASFTALAAATVGTSLAAASAGTFNQLYEIKSDAKMMRTHTRPLPSGIISPRHAAAFGAATLCVSAATLAAGANDLTMLLGVGNVALYSLVYTPLKQSSELNTAVGALVGAIPPLMGWAAATGGLLAYEPIMLGLALFWWQFPHFYSLAWTLKKDYARGGYVMVPVADATGKRTAWLSLRSALALSTLPFAAVALGVATPMFAVEGALLNAYFVKLAYNFYKAPGDGSARKLFRTSLWYLPLLLALMVFHSTHWQANKKDSQLEDVSTEAALVVATPEDYEPTRSSKSALNSKDTNALIEKAMVNLHALGRSYCIHEILVENKIRDATATLQLLVRHLAAMVAPTVAPSGDESQITDAAIADVRGKCPVVSAETAAKTVMPTEISLQVVEEQPSMKSAQAHT